LARGWKPCVATPAKELAEHLPKWYSTFELLLEMIETLPGEAVRAAKPNVVEIHVYRGVDAIPWNRTL
jgi:hypothetical protein